MIALALIAFAAAAGFAAGTRYGARARNVYREIAYWSGERMDAWRKADMCTDLDQVGPVSHVTLRQAPPYDWAAEDQGAADG